MQRTGIAGQGFGLADGILGYGDKFVHDIFHLTACMIYYRNLHASITLEDCGVYLRFGPVGFVRSRRGKMPPALRTEHLPWLAFEPAFALEDSGKERAALRHFASFAAAVADGGYFPRHGVTSEYLRCLGCISFHQICSIAASASLQPLLWQRARASFTQARAAAFFSALYGAN